MIPLAKANYSGNENEYDRQARAGKWFIERFEAAVAHAAGRRWAVAVTKGTHALHAAAYVLGFQDREIDIPEHAYRAMWNVAQMLGCHATKIPGGTKHDAELYRVRHTHWPTLADCAPALGNEPTEAQVDCYSFAPNKTVTTDGGGAVCGDDPALEKAIREAVGQSRDCPGPFAYKMPNVNAAIGCAQMERLDEFREIKARIWDRYAEAMPMIERGPSRWMATVQMRSIAPTICAEMGFETVLERSGGMSLPCSTSLTDADQDRVIAAVCGG